MTDGIDRTMQATVIAAALCDIADACRAQGSTPPDAITFRFAKDRAAVADVLASLANVDGLRIKIRKTGVVEVAGIALKLRNAE